MPKRKSMTEPMSEREVKTLQKLLKRLRAVKEPTDMLRDNELPDYFSLEGRGVIGLVETWVGWYGEALGYDLK